MILEKYHEAGFTAIICFYSDAFEFLYCARYREIRCCSAGAPQPRNNGSVGLH